MTVHERRIVAVEELPAPYDLESSSEPSFLAYCVVCNWQHVGHLKSMREEWRWHMDDEEDNDE